MGYRLNRLDEPVLMAVPKPMLTEFGIHYRLESCEVELHYLYGVLFLSGLPESEGDPASKIPRPRNWSQRSEERVVLPDKAL